MNNRPQIAALGALLPDQPPPTPGTGDVWRELIDAHGPAYPDLVPLMEERRLLGIQRYGQPLQRGDSRSHAVDAQQEAADLAAYCAAEGWDDLARTALDMWREVRRRADRGVTP